LADDYEFDVMSKREKRKGINLNKGPYKQPGNKLDYLKPHKIKKKH
jgi:hypothetical protein